MRSHFYLFIIICLFVSSCKGEKEREEGNILSNPVSVNSIYYWKTTFKLDKRSQNFLKEHNVKRLYIRYFDVSSDNSRYDYENYIPVPHATIRFEDPVPENIEIIPTVFIDNDAFRYVDMQPYVEKLVDRILIMSETNDILNIKEVQLDCDWTKTTESDYFDFLFQAKKRLAENNIELSATIRLHQLNMKPPPVDRGVLMCYNTGAIKNPKTSNSILRSSDVEPYVKHLSSYRLPLDVAYPTFSWSVWFRNGEFQALLRDLDLSSTCLTMESFNVYTVNQTFYQEGHVIREGDEIRYESSNYNEIERIKKMIETKIVPNSIIIYHLDSQNLSKYTKNEISKIYNN